MVGGPQWAYDEFESVFDAVATGPDGHERMGPAGSGHYVKMVHNGVEYALMQTYGEGVRTAPRGAVRPGPRERRVSLEQRRGHPLVAARTL